MTETQRDRILVVEDHRGWRENYEDALGAYSSRLDIKNDGQAGKLALETNGQRYEILITDLHLPAVTGYELARLGRELNIPYIRIASNSDTPSQVPPQGVEITGKGDAINWALGILARQI